MTSRRQFLQIGIAAASAWPLANQVVRAAGIAPAGAEPPAPLPLYKALYDMRFPQSVAFARRVRQVGVPVHAIEGDMTRFWYDDLYHQWKQAPVAIAGLTAFGPLFCLEQLAIDQRMRVVFRAEHNPSAAGGVDHRFSGPVGMLAGARGAADAGDWAASMADLVTQCPSGRTEIGAAACRSAADGVTDRGGEPLYSWVIAPAVRA